MPNLAKQPKQTPRSVQQLVRMFGFSIPKHRRRRSFFDEFYGELEYIYYDCKKKWLEMIKAAHPDNGGNHELAAEINVAWDRLTLQFSRRCKSIRSSKIKSPDPKPVLSEEERIKRQQSSLQKAWAARKANRRGPSKRPRKLTDDQLSQLRREIGRRTISIARKSRWLTERRTGLIEKRTIQPVEVVELQESV